MPWSRVWPGALGATIAIGVVDLGFPLYLDNVSTLRIGTSAVFVLIALVWFYVIALIVLAGAVVNALRFEPDRVATARLADRRRLSCRSDRPVRLGCASLGTCLIRPPRACASTRSSGAAREKRARQTRLTRRRPRSRTSGAPTRPTTCARSSPSAAKAEDEAASGD